MTAGISTAIESTAAMTATTHPFARSDDGLEGLADPTFGLNVPTCGMDLDIVRTKDMDHFDILSPTLVESTKGDSNGSTPPFSSHTGLSDLECADL